MKIQEAEGISDNKASHILTMLVEAGADTSASLLQNVFKILALNPEAAVKAQAGKNLNTSSTPSVSMLIANRTR